MFGDEDSVKKIDSSYTSRVSEIFNVILKSLGIGLEFLDDEEAVRVLNDDYITQHTLNGKTIMCTDYQFYLMERASEIKEEILEEHPVLTNNNLKEMIESVMKKRRYINGPLNEEIGEFAEELQKELDAEYDRIKTEKLKMEASEEVVETLNEVTDESKDSE